MEAGLGWNFEIGGDVTATSTEVTSGPWTDYQKQFTGSKPGSIYEDAYFKQGGELTQVDPAYYSQIHGNAPLNKDDVKGLAKTKVNSSQRRDPRGNLVSYFRADMASNYGVADSRKIYSYTSSNGFGNGAATSRDSFNRYENAPLKRRAHHISEVVQTQTDGKRYVYGIPAMNNIQKEATFAIQAPSNPADIARGVAPYNGGDDTKNNGNGIDHYYSSSLTPASAHSYLLTSVLSTDYVDVSGDGPTDDDFGSYTKFNYARKDSDYRWRAPYESGKASYNPGFYSDKKDDKGSYLIGSREQ